MSKYKVGYSLEIDGLEYTIICETKIAKRNDFGHVTYGVTSGRWLHAQEDAITYVEGWKLLERKTNSWIYRTGKQLAEIEKAQSKLAEVL